MRKATYLLLVMMLLASSIAACGPTPEPVTIIETVVVEKEVPVEVTRVVEVEKEIEVAAAPSVIQEWELVNPQGVVLVEPLVPNTHPDSLEGKTVALAWTAKPNGDIFLTRIGELLLENVKDVKVIKAWEEVPSTKGFSSSKAASAARAQAIADLNPDLVIGAQGD